MSKLFALTKVLIKNNLLSNFSSKNGKKGYGGLVAIILLLGVVGVSLCIPIVFALDSILKIAPIENIIISFVLPIAGITTIVFSIFSVVSVFYLNKDSEHLLSMPIPPRDIILSKFLVSLVTDYYILFMFILPCLIGVGVGIDASALYYVYMLVIFIFLPVIPSAIVTLIILFITKFTGVIKNKDLFMYVSMGLILVFSFVYNYVIQEFMVLDSNNMGSTINSLENAVLPYFKMIFPFYNSASNTLINYESLNAVFSLIAFIGFNLIALLVIYLVGDKLYLKTLINTRGNKKKKVDIDKVVNDRRNKNIGINSWLLKKEWLIIKRTPIFMLNIVIIVFIMPIIIVVSFLLTYLSSGEDMAMMINIPNFDLISSNPIIYLIIFAVAVFFTSTSVAASTSISREGRNAWFMKVMPVSYFKQINIKVLFAVIIDMLGVTFTALVPIIIFKIPISYVVYIFVPLLILVTLINYLNILLDLKRPKLNWSEEADAVKQNINSMISIFGTMGICSVFGVLAFIFYKYGININVGLLSSIISIVCGIILTFVVYYFYKNSNKLVKNIE